MHYKVRNKINRILSYGRFFRWFNIGKSLISRSLDYQVGEVDEFHKKHALQFNAKSCVEIGAGRSLGQNLFLSNVLERQYVYDIDNLLIMKMVNAHACQLTEVFDWGKE